MNGLARHEQLRAQGAPTVTVLCPSGAGALALRRWCERSGLLVVESLDAWFAAAAASGSLFAAAARHLGRELGVDGLLARLTAQTRVERELLLDGADRHGQLGELRRAILLELPLPGPDASAAAALHWLTDGAVPVLLLRADAATLDAQARTAAALVEDAASFRVAIGVDRAPLDAYLAGPESRPRALVRAGILTVATLDERGLEARLGGGAALAPTLRLLAELGASDDTAELMLAAARPASEGRSAHERFLFAVLDTLFPGEFQLNGAPGFRFGGRPAEVDLLCARHGIAIEIDGYHHFKDVAAYRHDREKDFLMQEAGLLVLRFHADDLVPRLEAIVARVRSAIELCRERTQR